MKKRFEHVAVLMGGLSSEREVSLESGRAVARGLRAGGYRVEEILLDRNALHPDLRVDGVFIALHGEYGEDGGVQQDLDRRRIPYVGSGAEASRRAFDKRESKRTLIQNEIPTASFELLGKDQNHVRLDLPVVVKPPRQGSSEGVGWVFRENEWAAALAAARKYDEEIMVERYIAGRELTVGIVDDETLPVVEILAPEGRFDKSAKYTRGRTGYRVLPADDDTGEQCRLLAGLVFKAFGARGFGRVDFRVSPEGGPFVLELNTIPGFTENSLLPKAAAAAGIDFVSLCAGIMEMAIFDEAGEGPA